MIENPNFYSVIIGSELLNGRRVDKHFEFLNQELLKRGFEQKASFIIKDEPKFIEDIFKLILNDKNSVMFSFGGIGATPDDLTREVSAKVFRDSKMEFHIEAKELIVDRFKESAYPHRVNMAKLPVGSKLLKNVVNQVAGYYLDDRFFFTPGFPEMAHPMVVEALDKLYSKNSPKYRESFTIFSGENSLIDIMKRVNESEVELSSLPQIVRDRRAVVISIASIDKDLTKKWVEFFLSEIEKLNLKYKFGDIHI
jgi:molybdopterin-biosynthesis enzyme MoeA-like protein